MALKLQVRLSEYNSILPFTQAGDSLRYLILGTLRNKPKQSNNFNFSNAKQNLEIKFIFTLDGKQIYQYYTVRYLQYFNVPMQSGSEQHKRR